MKDSSCSGSHRFFVAESGFDAVGNVVVILVCTACGDPLQHSFKVPSGIELASQSKKEK